MQSWIIYVIGLTLGNLVFAQGPDVTVHGESQFFLKSSHRPSSEAGVFSFDFGRLSLSPQFQIRESLSLEVRLALNETRPGGKKSYITEVQNAFVRMGDPRNPKWTHELGLVRSFWKRYQGAFELFDFLGPTTESFASRFRFIENSDLGYQGHYKTSENSFWVLGFVNGEENRTEELGPNKEAFLGSFFQTAEQQFHILLSLGRVDNIEAQISQKNKILLRYQRSSGRFTAAFELMKSEDPSLDLESNERAEGMTFGELSRPQNLESQGGRVELQYRLSDRRIFMTRFDLLQSELKDKDIESFSWGIVQIESEDLKWGFLHQLTRYGAEHSARSRQNEALLLGLALSF